MSERSGTTQPFLHDLVSCVRAPLVAISGRDGQVRPHGAHGFYDGDTRLVSCLEVRVGGVEPEPLGHALGAAGCAEFVGVLRRLGDPMPDPTVTLTRTRTVSADGVREVLVLQSSAQVEVVTDVEVRAAVDLAAMTAVKGGDSSPSRPATRTEGGLVWTAPARNVHLDPDVPADEVDAAAGTLRWRVTLPPRGRIEIRLHVASKSSDSHGSFRPVATERGDLWSTPTVVADDPRLAALLDQGLRDAESLLVGDPDDPRDRFLAAGSPWFLTLFGRDSLWAARMMLPLGTELARGTLASLARRQGKHTDASTEEQPGKILHEVRGEPLVMADGLSLPARYYGTVDATPLWVCLLADAARWGMPDQQVEDLLGPLEAALHWMVEHGDSDGDGFLEYVDTSGSGLTNQGWKDSGDSIQWADGHLADAPLALCEVQGYAYEAAVAGADLLERFGRAGTDRWRSWAAALKHSFRDRFWTEDASGPFPAVALDRDKRRVDSLTSNIGHLLGTGLLDVEECAVVASRLGRADMDSGYGLRTLSAYAPRFGPLSYHGGSVWPHDTAIAITGLARTGHEDVAASLLEGVLTAAEQVEYRLPELYGGSTREHGRPLIAYPAACRPQAWAAASAVALLQALLGIAPDTPAGTLDVRPMLPAVVGAVSAHDLRIAGGRLDVVADRDGHAEVSAPMHLRVATR